MSKRFIINKGNSMLQAQCNLPTAGGMRMSEENVLSIKGMVIKYYRIRVVLVVILILLFLPTTVSILLQYGTDAIYMLVFLMILALSGYFFFKSCSVKCRLLDDRRFEYCSGNVICKQYSRARGMSLAVATSNTVLTCYAFKRYMAFHKNDTVWVILFDCSGLGLFDNLIMHHSVFAIKRK